MQTSIPVVHGFSSCSSQALDRAQAPECGTWPSVHQGTWNLPRPGIEPVSPALAGGFFITEPLVVKVKSLSRVRLFATPWTVAYQTPLSMGFSRRE